MSSLNEKLSVIQRELKAPKSQINKFGNYAYRSAEDILEALKPHLNGLTLVISDDVVEVGGRVYIKATTTLSDGKESISNTAFAREPESKKGSDESQITGGSSSYARKYALNGLFLIDDTKDADATNTHGKEDVNEGKPTRRTSVKSVSKPVETTQEDTPSEPVRSTRFRRRS